MSSFYKGVFWHVPDKEELIKSEFSLLDEAINIRFVADGSFHYEYLAKF